MSCWSSSAPTWARLPRSGSIVGTRQDMVEALDFYARGLIHPTYTRRPLSDVKAVLDEMHHGKIAGRVVIDYTED